MAAALMGLLGGSKKVPPSPASGDPDFADFAEVPDPSPIQNVPLSPSPVNELPGIPTSNTILSYSKWNRIRERVTPRDFIQEAIILPLFLISIAFHVWGRRNNKRRASSWIKVHGPLLEKEFAVVGFGGREAPTVNDVQASGLAQASAADHLDITTELLRQETAQEYITYATGRLNVAYVNISLTLLKRYNPVSLILEYLLSQLFDSVRTPVERMEATAITFDGKEKELVPGLNRSGQESGETRAKGFQSSYDGFVWAIVNKDTMRELRFDRYDISLTTTKDHAKLPSWATIMSESAEVTDILLTPALIKAVEQAGDEVFENLIITDQPLEKPKSLDETGPHKRISLSLKLPSSSLSSAHDAAIPIFTYFLSLPDKLVASAHFRPEVLRKIRSIRDEEIKKLRKVDEDEKAEERKLEGDKKKKAEREAKLKGMNADEQRKFLDRERERDQKRSTKKMTRKG